MEKGHAMPDFSLSKHPPRKVVVLCRCLLVGGCMGFCNSLMVNSALIEVSVSPFFAISFGVLFIASAGIVFHQMCRDANVHNFWLLAAFASLNLASGAVCFVLERDWSHGITASSKVPLYAMLGMCLAFSVSFSFLDLLARCDSPLVGAILVRTEWQVRVIACISLVTGGLYGFTFGYLKIEDSFLRSPLAFREALHRDSSLCYPLGAGSGAIAAVAARLLEQKAEADDPDLAYARGLGGRLHDDI